MISRYLVIALALAAAGFKATQGAWVEAAGLAGLGVGLVALRFSSSRPELKGVAWSCFAVTVVSIAILAVRRWAA